MSLGTCSAEVPLSERVLEQAAEWYALLNDDQVAEELKAQWQVWIEAHDSHRRAWARIETIDQRLASVPSSAGQHALRAAATTRRRVLLGLAGIALLGPVSWLSYRHLAHSRVLLATRIGEVRKEILADGAVLWLNTDSSVAIDYDHKVRQVRLLSGEVLVESAADPRPFILYTASGSVSPIGTRFTVREMGDHTVVSVIQGRVRVQPSAISRSLELAAKQSVVFSQDRIQPPQSIALNADAWLRGILVADDILLTEFLDQLNRYYPGDILYDHSINTLRIVGRFPLQDTQQVLRAIERSLPVNVAYLSATQVQVTAK